MPATEKLFPCPEMPALLEVLAAIADADATDIVTATITAVRIFIYIPFNFSLDHNYQDV
jgi:hypothetical protein